jgi:hypothetical protein
MATASPACAPLVGALIVRIPEDLGARSGVIWAAIPEDLGALGEQRRLGPDRSEATS